MSYLSPDYLDYKIVPLGLLVLNNRTIRSVAMEWDGIVLGSAGARILCDLTDKPPAFPGHVEFRERGTGRLFEGTLYRPTIAPPADGW